MRAVLVSALVLVAPLVAKEPADIVATAAASGKFATLVNALVAADLASAIASDGPFTVFAPSEEAFAKLPDATLAKLLKPENREQLRAILKYHVVAGKVPLKEIERGGTVTTLNGAKLSAKLVGHKLKVGGVGIVKADVVCRNGIIHVIDGVLMPPTVESGDSIVDVAAKAGSFKTLLAAAKAAGLAETLAGEGPFTVFAPTDEAFAKLPAGTVESLLKPENRDKLRDVLKYHVLKSKVTARDAVTVGSARTLQGGSVAISIADGRLTVNDSKVVATDVKADNGIIHVIDMVLMPGSKDR